MGVSTASSARKASHCLGQNTPKGFVKNEHSMKSKTTAAHLCGDAHHRQRLRVCGHVRARRERVRRPPRGLGLADRHEAVRVRLQCRLCSSGRLAVAQQRAIGLRRLGQIQHADGRLVRVHPLAGKHTRIRSGGSDRRRVLGGLAPRREGVVCRLVGRQLAARQTARAHLSVLLVGQRRVRQEDKICRLHQLHHRRRLVGARTNLRMG